MDAFRVYTDADGSYDMYDDGSSYTFNDAGLLVAVQPDGKRRIYSPHGWTWLEDQEAPPITAGF